MSRLIIVLINWNLKTQLNMIALGLNVAKMMGVNITTFALPDVALTILEAAVERLQVAYNGRGLGDEGKTEYTNATLAMDELLHIQAIYVNKTAKGSAAIIEKAGFKATTNVITRKVITKATDAAALATNGGGGLKLTLLPVLGASSYIHVIFLGLVGTIEVGLNYVKPSVQAIVMTKAKLTERLSGIASGTIVTVFSFAQNSAGISPSSASSSTMIN